MALTTWDEVDELLDRYDGNIKLTMGGASSWCCEIRLTLTDPIDAASRSMTFYSAAGATPEDVARTLLEEIDVWLDESDEEPMPAPRWARAD